METERIALSQGERDRLKVLHDVKQKHLTQVEAAGRLKMSDRQVRRLLMRMEDSGDRALVHGLRGRASNRKLALSFEQKIVARVRQRYADFGPTLAAEHLAKEGLLVSRETLRKWMVKEVLWRPRRQRVKNIHVWRERRASFGELVMQDSSPFRWFEERGPACHLIAMIDDATSRVWARFVEHDTTEENLRTLGGWLQRYGRPVAHYTDKNSIFRTAGPAARDEQLRGEAARSQFGRALEELGMEWIAAHSPQAKGRIERLFETLQDRLVKEMRLAGIDTIEAGNYFLEKRFLPQWEERFTVAPRHPRNAHRRLGREQRLEEILSVRGPQGGPGSHRQLGGKPLGCAQRRSLRWAARSASGNRTASGWLALAALPWPLSAAAALPGTGAARGKSFRPTAYRTCRKSSFKKEQKRPSEPSVADISIWQKTGHFYFALTPMESLLTYTHRSC